MAIKPIGSSITAGGNQLFVLDIQSQPDFILFQRVEFDHERLASARHQDTTKSIIQERISAGRVQIAYGCGLGDTPKFLTPNDVSPNDLNNIYKKFDIIRYTITGDVSLAANVDAVATTAHTHKQAWTKFENRQQEASSGNHTYEYMVNTLQIDTLSYLTSTGFNISGAALTANNLLIKEFTSEVAYEVPQSGGGSTLYKSFKLVAESITIINGLS